MLSVEKKLENYMETLTQAREELLEKKGSLQNHMARFKKDFGCSSLAEVAKLLKQLGTDGDKLKTEMAEIVSELDEKYGDR